MDIPWQVRGKLCAIGLALLPIIVSFGGATSRVGAQETMPSCVDPSSFTRSVVSISWQFAEPRRDGRREIIGERATAWFYTSPRFLVTAAHFAQELSAHDWQEANLRRMFQEYGPDVSVRVRLRVAVEGKISELAEDLAILELQEPFPDAQALDLQLEAPSKDATVLVVGYPRGQMKAALGFIREAEKAANRYPGLTFLEVQGSNRLLLNGGASGAPVIDCRRGRVVAVLNGLLTGPSLPFLPPESAVMPTPWGSPTNTAVPAATLNAISGPIL